MSVQMIALKPHVYAGRRRNPGDYFLVSGETDARILAAVGNAKRTLFDQSRVEVAVPSVDIDEYVRELPSEVAALNAEPDPVPAPEPLAVVNVDPAPEMSEPDLTTRRGRREYRRRDLRAEGDKS